MARKRHERNDQGSSSKAQEAQQPQNPDEAYWNFKKQLAAMGLELRDIPGDGNCLFRALGDQLEGHSKSHWKHRVDVCNYMEGHREDFEPFIEDGRSFPEHLTSLRQLGTYAGNDAIVAFARLNKITVVIHQLGSPLWKIHGSDDQNAKEIHISFHNGDHYSSVRRLGDTSSSPTNIRLKDGSEQVEKTIKSSSKSSSGASSSRTKSATAAFKSSNPVCQYRLTDNGTEFSWERQSEQRCTAANINSPYNSSAQAIAQRGVEDIVAQVMTDTGCTDEEFVRDCLLNHGFEVDEATAFILKIACQGRVKEGSVYGSSPGQHGAQAASQGSHQQHLGPRNSNQATSLLGSSHKMTGKDKKAIRKARQMERHKARLQGLPVPSSQPSSSRETSSDEEVLVQNMGTLCI